MGIESDQVVYEYLSRVGDVAQQRQLSSATRMRLVNELRDEIDRRRAKAPADSPAAVRRIIARLGTPDDVVTAASGTGTGPATPSPSVQVPPARPTPAVPVQRDGAERPKGLWRKVPGPRAADPEPAGGQGVPAADAPGLAGLDWWRDGPRGPVTALDDDIPGFVGGIEIPELLRPVVPRKEPEKAEDAEGGEKAAGERAVEVGAAPVVTEDPGPRRRRLSLPARRWSNPLLLLGAASLVAGAVLGNGFALLLGWVIAYASRRLTDTETKIAVMWLPGAALAAGAVWLWGRRDGRWGQPIIDGGMGAAVGETWPWVLRGAAIASALFLVWRSQRGK
ncbi:hypothetical protein [Streptomyces sp. bgisy159]|uniref:hypothetical protein n=1 Tax=Streptomyces sp. bgisy159 TaxID=3413795 RepID=UPI003F4A164A